MALSGYNGAGSFGLLDPQLDMGTYSHTYLKGIYVRGYRRGM